MADGAGPIDLSTATPPAANICPYAEIVADKARRHRLIEVDTGISARLPALAESERSVGAAYRNVGEGIVGVSTLAIHCMPPKVPQRRMACYVHVRTASHMKKAENPCFTGVPGLLRTLWVRSLVEVGGACKRPQITL